MRRLFTIATFCGALWTASPSQAAIIDIGTISLIDFSGLGAEIRIENNSLGLMFEDRPIQDAFTNLVLTVGGLEYAYARVGDVPDFYRADSALMFEPLLAGTGVSFLGFDPFVTEIGATLAFSFGGRPVQGGGSLALFEPPISLFVNIEGAPTPAPVPEPGTLLLLGTGLCAGAGRLALRRRGRRLPRP